MIETSSWRLKFAARLARLFPPGLSGFFMRLYPNPVIVRERAAFRATSLLAPVEIQCDRPDWVASSFAVRGYYEWTIVVIANTVCGPGDAIVEIGAHIGTESILYAQIVGPNGSVSAFEPLPDNVRMLRRQLELNRIQNVDVFPFAVSDRRQTLPFAAPAAKENFGQGRIIANDAPASVRAETIAVDCVRLDDLAGDGRLKAPRLLVIDVQGAELSVLRGAQELLQAAKPVIVFEVDPVFVNEQATSDGEMVALLECWGYCVWKVTKWGLRAPRIVGSQDANWLCIPRETDGGADRLASRISRRILRAALFPLIRGLNPAVIRPVH